jgi:hypothetical protein
MTLNKSETVNLPKWLIILILPIVIGGVSGLITASFSMGKNSVELQSVKKSVEKLEMDKVNTDVFTIIQGNIQEIKVDIKDVKRDLQDHMSKK